MFPSFGHWLSPCNCFKLINKVMNPGALEKGGVGALELVAMDMKAR